MEIQTRLELHPRARAFRAAALSVAKLVAAGNVALAIANFRFRMRHPDEFVQEFFHPTAVS